MRVDVGQAKTDPSDAPGQSFVAAHGSLAGQIWIAYDVELTDAELDEILDEPAERGPGTGS